jgi:hypothetical protein
MRYLLLLLLTLLISPVFGQTIEEQLDSIEAAQSAPSIGPKIDRAEVASMILQATEQSNLRPAQKNRIERIMKSRFRNAARDRIIDRVTQNLLDTGAVQVGPDGAQAAVDIKAIIAAIEKWLPVILQLLSLFGL